MENKIVIIGAGGHAKVVADAVIKQGQYVIAGFADDAKPLNTVINKRFSVIAKTNEIKKIAGAADYFVIAIGNNKTRSELFELFMDKMKPATIIHPSAVISENVKIGEGTVILANAVINEDSEIGNNCIINSMALIDHETKIGDNVHISQGSIVGSNCDIKPFYSTDLGECIDSGSIFE
jgi:sugar O-acyltransferase (sialic acid O-acetyltransferase NeuD family)